MTSSSNPTRGIGQKLALALALIFVVVGMINTLPEIPGLQNWAREVTGQKFLRISGFKTEYIFPPIFFVMMLIVVLDSSVYRAWSLEKPRLAWLGLLLDTGLINWMHNQTAMATVEFLAITLC